MQAYKIWLAVTTLAAGLARSQPHECYPSSDEHNCTLSLLADLQSYRQLIGLWDWECRRIGGVGTDGQWEPAAGQWSIGGRGLEHTIELVITHHGTPQRPNGGFWYGGAWHYLDQGWLYDCADADRRTVCTQVEFRCKEL